MSATELRVHSLKPLQNYIQKNINRLRASPCLLITSCSPPSSSTSNAHSSIVDHQMPSQQKRSRPQHYHDPKVHAFIQRNSQVILSKFNLRAVSVTISAAFPTIQNVNEAVSLAKRVGLKECSNGKRGEGTIIAIGSGAAMDLAKAVSDTILGTNTESNLILAPSTIGALWAACSNSPALLLDTQEEILLPLVTSLTEGIQYRKETVVTLDPIQSLALPLLHSGPVSNKVTSASNSPSLVSTAAAVLAILLDIAHSVDATRRIDETEKYFLEEMKIVASLCASVISMAIDQANTASTKNLDANDSSNSPDCMLLYQNLLESIIRLSPLLECSTSLTQTSINSHGTIPQKLANALLPTYFPNSHIITYLASTLPGLCEVMTAERELIDSKNNVGRPCTVEQVIKAIIDVDLSSHKPMIPFTLSSWVSKKSYEAGIPTMASLAYGTPNLDAMMNTLDAYSTMIEKTGGFQPAGYQDNSSFLEGLLQSSLNR